MHSSLKTVPDGSDGSDVADPCPEVRDLVAQVRAAVEDGLRAGGYRDARIVRAERWNQAAFHGDARFLTYYLDGLRGAVFVDLDPAGIRERRRRLRGVLATFKRCVWRMLGFYSARLWEQQNPVNAALAATTATLERTVSARIDRLEQALNRLEVPPS